MGSRLDLWSDGAPGGRQVQVERAARRRPQAQRDVIKVHKSKGINEASKSGLSQRRQDACRYSLP